MKLNTVIPFSGFYNSLHSEAIDNEISQLLQTSNGDVHDGLAAHDHGDMVDYRAACEDYAREYLKDYSAVLAIPFQFGTVDSPREYNFTTDRIYAFVAESDARRMLLTADASVMDRVAAYRHTSCDGFISYYSPDWREWGDITEWEPEQLHTLILAYEQTVAPDFDSFSIVESLSCNGELSSIVDKHLTPKGVRLANIASYLRQREQRSYRNCAFFRPQI